jgi:beta-barrel assembly-enhancing protease
MRPWILALSLAGLLLSASCATVASATRPAAQAFGNLLLSPEEELQLGNELAAQVRQEERVLKDPQVQSYVERLGQRIVAQTGEHKPPYPVQFTVIEAPDAVNAFALPGGHIFVYSGLIRAADSEAELASVLAHEVAHLTSGHPSDRLAAMVGTSTLQQLVFGRDPSLIAQVGSAIAAQGYLAAYSREQEREADSRGLQYLASAGYDPGAMARFFEELARLGDSNPNFVSAFLASHPAPGQRAETVAGLIQSHHYPRGRQSILGGFQRIQARV